MKYASFAHVQRILSELLDTLKENKRDTEATCVAITIRLHNNSVFGDSAVISNAMIKGLKEAKERGATQLEALKIIAAANGGVLVVKDALMLMCAAGYFKNPMTADAAIYTLLDRSGLWEKVKLGVYKKEGEQ